MPSAWTEPETEAALVLDVVILGRGMTVLRVPADWKNRQVRVLLLPVKPSIAKNGAALKPLEVLHSPA